MRYHLKHLIAPALVLAFAFTLATLNPTPSLAGTPGAPGAARCADIYKSGNLATFTGQTVSVEESLARLQTHFSKALSARQNEKHDTTSSDSAKISPMIFARASAKDMPAPYVSNMVDVMVMFDDALMNPELNFMGKPIHLSERGWEMELPNTRLLSRLHYTAVLGFQEDSVYWPSTRLNPRELKTFAGIYRNWSYEMSTSRTWLTHRHEPSAEEKQILAELQPHEPKIVERPIGIPVTYTVPHLVGIPESALPRYIMHVRDNKIEYFYPTATDIPKYLAAMNPLLSQIHQMLKESPRSLGILKPLARYYQLGIVGHPFARVNNSMLMAQVNNVLIRMGLSPVPHGNLDYMVRLASTKAAEALFIKYIEDAQPNPAAAAKAK